MARRKQGKELSMRKIREVFRLAMEHGMGEREISRSCSILRSTVGKYLEKVKQLGLNCTQIEAMDEEELRRLCRKKRDKKVARPVPDWKCVHKELCRLAISAIVFSPLIASSATLALKLSSYVFLLFTGDLPRCRLEIHLEW